MKSFKTWIDEYIPDIENVPSPPSAEFSYQDFQRQTNVGRGGTAIVSKVSVNDPTFEGSLALKQPPIKDTLDKQLVKKFLTEAEVWSKLDEYNGIVGVVDWGSKPKPWIVMEYMDGGSLKQIVQSIDVPQALWITRTIADAVWNAHMDGVAHLDIKPANVLLRQTSDGVWPFPKLCDWGISRVLLKEAPEKPAYTLPYAAPEQLNPDEFGPPNNSTDIYQLGVTLYELVTGQIPFSGEPPQVRRSILSEDAMPPSEVNSNVPKQLNAVIQTALKRQPNDRYESVLDLRRAIDDVLENLSAPQYQLSNPEINIEDPATTATRTSQMVDKTDNGHATRSIKEVASADSAVTETGPKEPLQFDSGGWPLARGTPQRNPSVFPDFNLSSFEHRWSVRTVNAEVTGSIITRKNHVYIPRSDGLSVLNGQSGNQEWRYTDHAPIRDVIDDGNQIYVATENELVALSNSGERIWYVRSDSDESDNAESINDRIGSLGIGHGRVYWVDGQRLRAIDCQTGQEQWFQSSVKPDPSGRIATAPGTVVYYSDENAGTHPRQTQAVAVRSNDGAQLWAVGSTRMEHTGLPLVCDDVVYTASIDWETPFRDPGVTGIDISTGEVLFRHDDLGGTINQPQVTSMLILGGDVLLAGHELFRIDNHGSVTSLIKFDKPPYWAGAVHPNHLICGTEDGIQVYDLANNTASPVISFLQGQSIADIALQTSSPGLPGRPPGIFAATTDEVHAVLGLNDLT